MITILIPYFDQKHYRRRNVHAVISNFIENYPDCDIVIAEQVGFGVTNASEIFTEFLTNSNFYVYPIQVDVDRFNKSYIINTAVKDYIKSDIIMMSDADCIIPALDIEYLKSQLQEISIYFPFSKVNFFNEAHTRRFVANKPIIQAAPRQDHFINRYTGLINLFTRSTFDTVSGFDSSFEGWGGEDDAFVDKCNRLVAPVKRSTDGTELIHLYHPKSDTSEYLNSECFTWNKKRVCTIRRMSDKRLQEYVNRLKDGVDILDDIVREFDSEGKLSFSAVFSIGSGIISVDTAVYDLIPENGKVNLGDILAAVYRTDGSSFLSHIIDQIDTKITDMSLSEQIIVDKYREMC